MKENNAAKIANVGHCSAEYAAKLLFGSSRNLTKFWLYILSGLTIVNTVGIFYIAYYVYLVVDSFHKW
jgi:hypothetical protein